LKPMKLLQPQPELAIHGTVKEGFERIKEQFSHNFEHHKEIGASLAIYWRGEKIVDLWGGSADPNDPTRLWKEHTLCPAFSTTKGMVATACAVAHSRGYLSYEDRVAKYWPEFAQQGKEEITVKQLLNHQAGLVVPDRTLDHAILADHSQLAEILAAQKPAWTPGEHHGYHTATMGLYASEVLSRADPHHRTLGKFFQDEVAQPLGVEFYIGIPPSLSSDRIAQMKLVNPLGAIFHLFNLPPSLRFPALNPGSMFIRSMAVTPNFNPNQRKWLEVELGSGNGVGEARAVARIYSDLVNGGKGLGLKQETLDTLFGPPEPPTKGLKDMVMEFDTSYHLGYILLGATGRPSFSKACIGTPGAGGSVGFADLEDQIGFCYLMNKMGYHADDDPRAERLIMTLRECLEDQKREERKKASADNRGANC